MVFYCLVLHGLLSLLSYIAWGLSVQEWHNLQMRTLPYQLLIKKMPHGQVSVGNLVEALLQLRFFFPVVACVKLITATISKTRTEKDMEKRGTDRDYNMQKGVMANHLQVCSYDHILILKDRTLISPNIKSSLPWLGRRLLQ